jgi:hypothetical protein
MSRSHRCHRHRFVRVAEAMAELGRDDDTLAWTARGVAETHGWQTAKLYDLACAVHTKRGQPLEVLALRRAQHERMPSLSTYGTLRTAAETMDAWPLERDAARAALQRTDLRALVDALLSDGDGGLAWGTATAAPRDAIGADLWLRLAESRESEAPPTRSRCTRGSLTKCSRGPIGGRTRQPCESSSALERPRRGQAR